MTPIKTVSVIGMGAIGSAHLCNIADHAGMAGLRVVASGERARELRRNGVTVNGQQYVFPVVDAACATESADLLLVAVKQNQLQKAIADMRFQVGENTIILSLLNGITSEEILANAFGAEKVLYGLCVGIDAVRDQNGTNYSRLGTLPFGEAHNPKEAYSQKVRRVQAFFEQAGVPYEIPEDMLRTLWWKFMINVGVNQVSAVLGVRYGAFQRESVARGLMIEAFREVAAVSLQAGIGFGEEDITRCLAVLETLSPEGKTSMLQDVENRRETEVDIFAGTVMALGEKYGVEVPVNRMLGRLLLAKQQAYAFVG